MSDHILLGEIAKTMHICKILAQSFPSFYKKTGITPKMIFSYDNIHDGLGLDIAFAPREPTKDEWSTFIEEIFDAEKILISDVVINSTKNLETLEQIIYKFKEEAFQIKEKRQLPTKETL